MPLNQQIIYTQFQIFYYSSFDNAGYVSLTPSLITYKYFCTGRFLVNSLEWVKVFIGIPLSVPSFIIRSYHVPSCSNPIIFKESFKLMNIKEEEKNKVIEELKEVPLFIR